MEAVTTAIIWSSRPALYSARIGRCRAASASSVRYSLRRLPRARNSALRIVQMSSQPEMATSMASVPPSARSTKPRATVSTSTMTTCLSHAE